MKNLITLILLAFSLNGLAGEAPKSPAKPTKKEAAPTLKPQVKRPCKPGQTEEKDSCHEVKNQK